MRVNSRPNIYGLEKKKPTKSHPLVEIVGVPDIGKKYLAQLVAKKLYGNYLPFPNLSPASFTGRILLYYLNRDYSEIYAKPEWWRHVYLANMYEQAVQIPELLKLGPVVVTNYTTSFMLYNRALKPVSSFEGFFQSLPMPNVSIILETLEDIACQPEQLPLAKNWMLSNKILENYKRSNLPRTVKIKPDLGSRFSHINVNSTSEIIIKKLEKISKIKGNSLAYYTKEFQLKF